MLFEYEYDDHKYLVNLEYFDDDMAEEGMEVFRIHYSDQPEDWQDYEIRIFRVEGENLTPVKVTSLPKSFLDMMGEELERVMPKTYISNPYFDELMIFYGNTVLTSKDRFKPIACDQCGKKDLYEKKGKDNKAGYIQDIHTKLKADPNPAWPFKGDLQIQFSVSDKRSRLNEIDLDNLAKAILDSLKGVVFQDDAQIVTMVAIKECVNGTVAGMIAIKQLGPGVRP